MTIKSGQSIGLTAIGASDTTVLNPSAQTSAEIYSLTLHNTGATGRYVEIFLSADAASAAGERVGYEYVDAGRTLPLRPLTVPATYFLVAKADGTGVNIFGIYTLRTGTDV